MRLGDAIAALSVLSQHLPDGEDAELFTVVCDGSGAVVVVPQVEVTWGAETRVGQLQPPYGLLRVHTHIPEAKCRRGVAEEFDNGITEE